LFQGAGPSENSHSSCPLIGKEERKGLVTDRQTDRQHTFQKHSTMFVKIIYATHELFVKLISIQSICLLAIYLTSLAPFCVFVAFKD
jgi:hypothetical protein